MDKIKSIVVIGLSAAFIQVLNAKLTEKLAANEKTATIFSGYGKLILPFLWIVLVVLLGRRLKGLLAEAMIGVAVGSVGDIVGVIMDQVSKKEA